MVRDHSAVRREQGKRAGNGRDLQDTLKMCPLCLGGWLKYLVDRVSSIARDLVVEVLLLEDILLAGHSRKQAVPWTAPAVHRSLCEP